MSCKIAGLSEQETQTLVPEFPLIVAYRGSIAHGMYVPNNNPNSIDDKDVMSVCIPDLSYYFGNEEHETFSKRGVYEKWIREYDSVSYELKKFVSLLSKANPNVLSMLYLEKQHIIYTSPLGEALIAMRSMFSSKQVYNAYVGYAHGQLHKMQAQSFEGYMGEKRKTLVEKFGYDTKNAAHCIRLLRMCCEFLTTHRMQVDRSQLDGPELLDIKFGRWTLEQIKDEARRLFLRAETLYDRCTLPEEVNKAEIDSILQSLLIDHLKSSHVL